MSPERRALFLAAQHCQGGHSTAGDAIASILDVPFPLRMTDLVVKARAEGENPALLYPWLWKVHGNPKVHPYFTAEELEAGRALLRQPEGL